MIKKAFTELETHAWCAERFRTNEIRIRTLSNTNNNENTYKIKPNTSHTKIKEINKPISNDNRGYKIRLERLANHIQSKKTTVYHTKTLTNDKSKIPERIFELWPSISWSNSSGASVRHRGRYFGYCNETIARFFRSEQLTSSPSSSLRFRSAFNLARKSWATL